MPHDLGDFPSHVELASSRKIVGMMKLVVVGCNVRRQWQIGRSQEAGAREDEEQETSPLRAGVCREMHSLRFGKSLVLASDSSQVTRTPLPLIWKAYQVQNLAPCELSIPQDDLTHSRDRQRTCFIAGSFFIVCTRKSPYN
jgi:hypothetical protein